MRLRVGFPALLAIVLVLAFPCASRAGDDNYSHARIVRLSLVEGDVQVSRPETGGWENALLNLPIRQGYSLATGSGRAEVEFESGATARLAENTEMQFTELALSNGGRITRLTLARGAAVFYANLAREDSFIVLAPGVQASIDKSASFRVDVNNDSGSVSVLKGEINVQAGSGNLAGLQGFRPTEESRSRYRYAAWLTPLTLATARAACAAPWPGLPSRSFRFEIVSRGQGYKTFLFAEGADHA